MTNTDARVRCLLKSSPGRGYRWPERPDEIWYKFEDVVKEIVAPEMLGTRGLYIQLFCRLLLFIDTNLDIKLFMFMNMNFFETTVMKRPLCYVMIS